MFNIYIIGIVVLLLLIFLKTEREYDYKNKAHVSDYLPWGLLTKDSIVLNKNGSFQKTFEVIGRDLNSSTINELMAMRKDLNNILKRLDGNWNFFIDVKRVKVNQYLKTTNTLDLLNTFEKIREYIFLNSNNNYENKIFLTLSFLPPTDSINTIKDKLLSNQIEKDKEKELIHLENFINDINEFYLMLKNIFVSIKELNDEETLTFLHSCFSQNDNQIIKPTSTIYLDRYISDTPIITGLTPIVGDMYLGVISLLDFPTETVPCLFDILNNLNLEYRWSSRYIVIKNEEAQKIASMYKRKWSLNRKGIFTAIEDMIIKKDTQSNFEIEDRQQEADAMIYDLQNGNIGAGYYTFSLILKDKNLKTLEKNLQETIAKIQNLGFVAIKESINSLEAFFGSMPGNVQHNVRKPIVHTMTVSDLLPLSTNWTGNAWNFYLNGPPLLYCTSNNSTPFRFNLHQGDVGHTAIFGQTGGGKSVLLCTIALNWLKYTDSQVVIFDKGGSSRVLTESLDGKYYDLGVDNITFQPLVDIDEQEDREWAFNWLCDIYESQNIDLTGEQKNLISKALLELSYLKKEQRTLTSYWLNIQEIELKEGIEQYTNDGSFGKYFDGNRDTFIKDNFWQVFEMEKILNSKNIVAPMIGYIFYKLQKEFFTGKPTVLILDEFWGLLDNSSFIGKIKDWLKTLRKKNVSVVFATQELSDILNSQIKDTVLSSCPTKIYLPYKDALSSQWKGIYNAFGLNEKEIEIISSGKIKRDYFYKSISGNRVFQLNLSDIELAYLGASALQDQKECLKIKKNVKTKEEFHKKWLQYKEVDNSKYSKYFH